MYNYDFVSDYIESSNYFTPIKYLHPNYTKIDVRWEGYCNSMCEFYYKFILSSRNVYVIIDVLDLIPTIVKCDKLLNWFIKHGYITTPKTTIVERILQTNSKLFSEIVIFKKRIKQTVLKYIKQYKNYCKVGIQYRSHDDCVVNNNCDIDINVAKKVLSLVFNMTEGRDCYIFLSSANHIFSKQFSLLYNKTILFMSNEIPKHTSKIYNNLTYIKTVGDLIYSSLTDYVIVSHKSTYSKVVLYMFYKNKEYNKIKNRYKFITVDGDVYNSESYTDLKDNFTSDSCLNFPDI